MPLVPRSSPEAPAFLRHLGWIFLIVVAFAAVLTSCANSAERMLDEPPPDPDPFEPEPELDTDDDQSMAAGQTVYLYAAANPAGPPIAKAFYNIGPAVASGRSYYVAITFSEDFVDNTYGANSSTGYRKDKGHKFRDLVGSDHVIVGFEDLDGNLLYEIKLDYLAQNDDIPSGYASGGVWDGDGEILLGPDDLVLAATSSLDRNFNERGCVYVEDSPVDAECPAWEIRVIYEVWLAAEYFEETGFGGVVLNYIHASPSRADSTVPVIPGEPPAGCVPELDGESCDPPMSDGPIVE